MKTKKMKKRYYSFLLVLFSVITLSACGKEAEPSSEETAGGKEETGGTQMQELVIRIDGQRFPAALYNNETAQALMERLPMTLDMEELHGNEKFNYLDQGLPTNPENVGSILKGDIMLFGSDCLVLFYDDFGTSYSYTRIGHIEDEDAFVNALSGSTVEVTFEAGGRRVDNDVSV